MEKLIDFVERLRTRGEGIVFAESCTAGLLAATFGKIPGVSDVFCGSMVVYQTETKVDWLVLDAMMLSDPNVGPVAAETTDALAMAVLAKTPRATWSVAVTGHLGPNAPLSQDGIVFASIARRFGNANKTEVSPSAVDADYQKIASCSFHLRSPAPRDAGDIEARACRQSESVSLVIDWVITTICSHS